LLLETPNIGLALRHRTSFYGDRPQEGAGGGSDFRV
jgi:hypothetical protein